MLKVSPVMRRQWAAFRANRRGYWALWLFALLAVLALGARFIANERPLLVQFQGDWYTPVLVSYPETTFGGFFDTEANYRDPVVQELINADGWMLWPLIRFDHTTINYDLQVPSPAPPSAENWLGTDNQGRDVLARILYGYRTSILFGLLLMAASAVIGIAVGAVQGYYGGWTDLVSQRLIEVWSSMPILYLIIILSSFVVPSFWSLLVILLLFSWMALSDLVRAEFLRCRNLDYVRAAQALGVSAPVVMFRHILPNAMVATLTFMPFIVNGAIVTLTTLDFMGFGLPASSPSLGELLAQGKANLHAPWLALSGFIALALLLSLLIFIGEAVRDAFDPRKYLA
ncbi:ABC transporter permease [Isoalcanivorax beigongshangi]|uniref:ABC transporter permease n=1 Tax=Isoalcanivorax beigongshangi TaxID=3238810 RepID=UPI003F723630